MKMAAEKLSKRKVIKIAKEHYGADDALAQKIYDKLAAGFLESMGLSGMGLEKRVHYVFLMEKYTVEELAQIEAAFVESL